MKNPIVYQLEALQRAADCDDQCSVRTDEGLVPARPMGFSSWRRRLRATWLVFTGQADAVVWPAGQ